MTAWAMTPLPVFLETPSYPSYLFYRCILNGMLDDQLVSAEILSRTRFAERSEPSMNPW